jgi:DNA-binding transcriptional regulator YiaG
MALDTMGTTTHNERTMSGEKITRIREAMGLNKVNFARLVGTNNKTVLKWERGEVYPRKVYLRILERFEAEYLPKG